MKKYLLSFSVILLFTFYSIHQRTDSEEIKITPPKQSQTISQNPSSIPANSSQNVTAGQQPTIPVNKGQYKDGQYTGDTFDAFYGNVQVKAIIQNGKITDVQFLQSPNDRQTSIMINSQAMPLLTQEAIQAQNSQVDIISGATDTSKAFIQSLGSALSQAAG